MDELTLVARLRDDLPGGIDLTGPERRLAAGISAAAAGSQRRTARETRTRGISGARGKLWYSRRVVVAALAAAAVAATAAVYVVHSQPTPPGPGPMAGSQAGLIPLTATPRPAATAVELVFYATRAAAAAPAFDPNPHQWIYTKRLLAQSSAGTGGMLFGPPDERVTVESWTRVDGEQTADIEHGKLVIGPVFAGGLSTPGGWPDSSYPYLDSLPSRPAELKAVIEANLKAENYVVGSGDIGVFNAIQALMENKVLPLRLRAALYAVLASDPAVHFDPRVTDFAGQTGVAFYTRQEGYLKVEIVINPRTYAYLGDRYVAYRAHNLPAAISNGVPSGPYLHIRKGQVTGEEAVLQSGIVARAGRVP